MIGEDRERGTIDGSRSARNMKFQGLIFQAQRRSSIGLVIEVRRDESGRTGKDVAAWWRGDNAKPQLEASRAQVTERRVCNAGQKP